MAKVGTVSERAPVGHRPRGLQRLGRRLELLHATTRRDRARIDGARTAWRGSPTTVSSSVSRSHCGTARIPILKERLFGLTNSEGNHGEDVKEYYFYLDSTPTHSYMKYLYKYPQAAYPYDELVSTNRNARPRCLRVRAARYRRLRRRSLLRRVRRVCEGDAGRHRDPYHGCQSRTRSRGVARPADDLVPEYVVVGSMPGRRPSARAGGRRPACGIASRTRGPVAQRRRHARMAVHGERNEHRASLPDAEPRRHTSRTASTTTSSTAVQDAVNPDEGRTKASAHYVLTVPPGASETIASAAGQRTRAVRARRSSPPRSTRLSTSRRREADEFYATVIPSTLDRRRGQRHAAGARRHAVVEAVLQLRRRSLAGGAWRGSASSADAARLRGTTAGTT